MKFNHRVRSVDQLLATASKDSLVTAMILTPGRHEKIFREMGFGWPLVLGESVLPAGHCGPSCSKNTDGWRQKHKDRGKELFHYNQKWNWKMRRGHQFQYASRMVSREKERYPKTLHPPPSMELQILKRADGSIAAAFPSIKLTNTEKERLIIAINAMVEIFGYAFLMDEALAPIVPRRVAHWQFLIAKNRLWPSVLRLVQPLLKNLSGSALGASRDRFETICGFRPQLCAIGQQGFLGYVLYGFPEREIFLLDAVRNNRAICGFTANWDSVSQLSLTELLDKTKFLFEIPHSSEWRGDLVTRFQN